MKVTDLVTNRNFKILQHSEPGAGKTHRALSAVRFGPVYVIDTDNKFSGLVPRLYEAYGKADIDAKVEVDVPQTSDDFKQLMLGLPAKAKSFATIVLDTQSRAFELVLNDIKALNPKGDGRQIFGAALDLNMAYLRTLLGLPCNLVLNAHVGSEEMADGSSKLTSTTPGKFGKKMTEFFNEVHYLYLNIENKHRVRGEPSSTVVARTVRPKSMFDNQGIFLKNDLSVFDEVAYKL